jgi:hypothetical protein
MRLADLFDRYEQAFEDKYGPLLLPEQRRAMESIRQCRTASCGETMMLCTKCDSIHWHEHSCGHRSCPQCQNHTTTEWLYKQQAKLLPVRYYLITFTIPSQLRKTAYLNQRDVYAALFTAGIETIREVAGNPRHLGAEPGLTGVLHTHSRRKEIHPHVHFIMPGGGIDRKSHFWKQGSRKYMFPADVLKILFREKFLACLRELEIPYARSLHKIDWVVNIKAAGQGAPAMKYLSKYLYRGVIQERNILSDDNGVVTFEYLDAETKTRKTRSLPAVDFLFLILKHVLPKRFRRVRDYGFHHGNARKSLLQIQLRLHHAPPLLEKPERPMPKCQSCGGVLIVAPAGVRHGALELLRNRGSPS